MSKLSPFVLAVTFFLSGCATIPPPQPPKPALTPQLSNHISRINGVDYLPLNTVCEQYRMKWSWESAAQVIQVMTGNATVRMAPGLSVALVNGTPQALGAPVILQSGMIWVPSRSSGSWMVPVPVRPTPSPPTGVHAIRTVVIDAGHGGHDAGASGPGGIREKDVVLDVALRLRDRLQAEGIRVLMTREDDRFISLSKRAQFANRNNADAFISVHANASRSRGASGYEVYYLSEATDDAARAVAAAENSVLELESSSEGSVPGMTKDTEAIVWDLLNTENRTESRDLAAIVCRGMKQYLPSYNRGVKSARFYVLKFTQMPAILVEIGFITNKTEAKRLSAAGYRRDVCEGIAHGILTYKQSYEQTNGFSD